MLQLIHYGLWIIWRPFISVTRITIAMQHRSAVMAPLGRIRSQAFVNQSQNMPELVYSNGLDTSRYIDIAIIAFPHLECYVKMNPLINPIEPCSNKGSWGFVDNEDMHTS